MILLCSLRIEGHMYCETVLITTAMVSVYAVGPYV